MNIVVRSIFVAIVFVSVALGLPAVSFAGNASISASFGNADTESRYSSGGSSPGIAMFYTTTDSSGNLISHDVGIPNTSYLSLHHLTNGNTYYVAGTPCLACSVSTFTFPIGDGKDDIVTVFMLPGSPR